MSILDGKIDPKSRILCDGLKVKTTCKPITSIGNLRMLIKFIKYSVPFKMSN